MWKLRKKGKEICPACGKKRFVPFVDEDGNLAGEQYGRCDREQSCGYFLRPTMRTPRTTRKDPPVYLPLYYDTIPGAGIVTLANSLLRAFAHYFSPGLLAAIMREYKCGTSADGGCWYFQFDGAEYRTGKLIRYQRDGHRDKSVQGAQWYHTSVAHSDMSVFELHQCWYGQHLLAIYPAAPVYIVEAEKTAILCTCYYLDRGERRVYLAAGGSQMVKALDWSVLDGRNITVVPDDGQCSWDWYREAIRHGAKYWRPQSSTLPAGYDVWDILEDSYGDR